MVQNRDVVAALNPVQYEARQVLMTTIPETVKIEYRISENIMTLGGSKDAKLVETTFWIPYINRKISHFMQRFVAFIDIIPQL